MKSNQGGLQKSHKMDLYYSTPHLSCVARWCLRFPGKSRPSRQLKHENRKLESPVAELILDKQASEVMLSKKC